MALVLDGNIILHISHYNSLTIQSQTIGCSLCFTLILKYFSVSVIPY